MDKRSGIYRIKRTERVALYVLLFQRLSTLLFRVIDTIIKKVG